MSGPYDEVSDPQQSTPTAVTIRAKAKGVVEVRPARSDFPRSQSVNWTPPVQVTPERDALRSIQAEWDKRSWKSPDYEGYTTGRPVLIADLYDFEVYRSPQAGHQSRQWEMTSLHLLEVTSAKKLCVDGFLCLGNIKHYVQGIEIKDSSVEGYGDNASPSITAYVQSELASTNARYDIWFRLNIPTPKYKRFHDPFLWVAQFGKHVIDFLDEQTKGSVGLECFRGRFFHEILPKYEYNTLFRHWHQEFEGQTDFRVAVHAYKEYIYRQAVNLPNSKALLAHPLWAECMVRGLTIVQKQDKLVDVTLATPDVHALFQDMYFGSSIKAMSPSPSVRVEQERRKSQLGFKSLPRHPSPGATPICLPYGESPVQISDVIAFDPHDSDQALWRNSSWEWLAYVQGVQPHEEGGQRLFVLYLYRPQETNIFNAKYPFGNELFFSDNCNCNEGILLSKDINGKYDVQLAPSTIPANGCFVRQLYVTQESSFKTFQEKHKVCMCKTESSIDEYRRGDTVYIMSTVRNRKFLEPVVIKEFHDKEVTFRKLARLKRDLEDLARQAGRTNVAANELVLTDEYETVSSIKIQRRCNIRLVTKQDIFEEKIPFPYNRGGAGDFWFLSMGISTKSEVPRLVFLARLPPSFNEGPHDLTLHGFGLNKLPGLGIFSGGGNLDRGFEEGGAVELRWTVDFSAEAIHTQRANAQHELQFFLGSVDDYLKASLGGEGNPLIARIGQVGFIAAGSPCPGFSSLQQKPLSEQSIRNASHISTFCSFVDLYRPEYAVLENVVNMASKRKGFETQNVLSQVVGCVVSMGYQVNQYIMDAWCYGSAQQRSRLFITITAPGLAPIVQPWHTHSLRKEDTAARNLGKLPNGERFGAREHYPTPFAHVSAGEVTADLPNIGNSSVQTCVSHPDHRVSAFPVPRERALLQCIPKQPPGSGYREAFKLGLIPPSLQKSGKEDTKAYKRVTEAGLIPTITTGLSPQDSCNGATIHWAQDRPITILDARRAQGYLDNEPIVGSLVQQYKIVGNGVDRKVSFALGLALRQAMQQDSENSASSRLSLGATRSRTSKTPGNASNLYKSTPKPDAIRTPGLDGSSDVSDPRSGGTMATPPTIPEDVPPNVTKTTPPSAAAGLLSRISATVAKGLGGMALLPQAYLLPQTPATMSMQAKRRRDEDMPQNEHTAGMPDVQSGASKRAKADEASTPSAVTNRLSKTTPTTDGNDTTKVERRSIESDVREGPKKRSTRLSGLQVEFTPKQWNRQPEREYVVMH